MTINPSKLWVKIYEILNTEAVWHGVMTNLYPKMERYLVYFFIKTSGSICLGRMKKITALMCSVDLRGIKKVIDSHEDAKKAKGHVMVVK